MYPERTRLHCLNHAARFKQGRTLSGLGQRVCREQQKGKNNTASDAWTSEPACWKWFLGCAQYNIFWSNSAQTTFIEMFVVKNCKILQKETHILIKRKLRWLPTPSGWQLHHQHQEASLWWVANIALSGRIYFSPQFHGFLLPPSIIGRLGRGALGTSTWGSTSPTGRRWLSSWSPAKPVILSCFMRANCTRFFRQAQDL